MALSLSNKSNEVKFMWMRHTGPILLLSCRIMKEKLIAVFLLIALASCAQKLKTENVVLITMDGLRWQELFKGADPELITNKEFVSDSVYLRQQFWAETPGARREILMPFFWKVIAGQGQLYGNREIGCKVNCSNTMWFSYPGYSEILTGAADDARINSNDKFKNPNVTVLEFLNKRPAFKGRVAAFGSWDVFPYIINEERSGIPVNAGFEPVTDPSLSEREKFLNDLQTQIPSPWSTVRLDAFTHHFALEYLKRATPRLLYIAYGETDDFAHDGNYSAYLTSARQTDKFIEELWTWTQSQPQYRRKTTFIITTDHGRGTVPVDTWKHHGTEIEGSDQIWIAIIGPDTPSHGEMKDCGQHYQNQVAKTVAACLGVKFTGTKAPGSTIATAIKGL